ncbi:nickel pincer cofactor biosynthesis protein LarC [Halobellus sp. Atlit-38R]|uniref:nickel pincer cofactor biosynthesis protein LarC n=1 Tax=Halobellus sp. Atlit-38R TaxID=2282131 RepID=UPI000EF1994D|nr:nickel pincer cofactor biosynthesis protein LarC [Halobellus sp. Atlit-38R]RLM89597.1 nickel pincer cofactor biosynthesis protein LarC [Halobellus sp. Atlit-38R]
MRTLAFDGRMGASGDMLLAALLAAGADPDVLAPVEDALGIRYDVDTVDKNGIAAMRVRVLLDEDEAASDDHGHDHDQSEDGHDEDGHNHDYSHSHTHTHAHEHSHDDHDHSHSHGHSHDGDHGHDHPTETPAEGHGPHRTYAEVVELVEAMALPASVEADATAIFRRLGEAEATVHDTDLEDTHFHEVGADDAIADVVGVALLLDDLDVERVVTTPLSTGDGTQGMAHGEYPIPAPAVVEIATDADWALRGGPVDAELLTPTGAAILAHIAEGVDTLPTLDVDAAGYGAGGYDFPDRPNVLRAIVGDGGERLVRDEITVLETNLDDAAPELLGSLQETLQEAGARDVSILPATMKKSRPGHLVKVIAKPEDAERVAHRLAVETGTLGVREHGAGHRWVASREFRTATLDVDGERYEVAVKVAADADGEIYDYSAEYDDALAVTEATDLPVREVMRRAENAVRDAE